MDAYQLVHVLAHVETAIDQENCTHLAEQHLSFRLMLLHTYYSSTQVACQQNCYDVYT